MVRIFPLLFVVLWASAFITSKVIVHDATPFASLGFRFALVALGFLIFAFFIGRVLKLKLKPPPLGRGPFLLSVLNLEFSFGGKDFASDSAFY